MAAKMPCAFLPKARWSSSSVVNYLGWLEVDSANLSSQSAKRFADHKALFDKLAKENKKYGKRIKALEQQLA
jgi:hypothetical protein